MSFASTLLLAFAMSIDAFAVAISKGAALHRPRLREALRTGLIFGGIEALTPVIGWMLGRVAAPYLVDWDHWIAFSLLAFLGGRMLYAGFSQPEKAESLTRAKKRKHPFWLLAATAFATSIDALMVGVGLALLDVNIFSTATVIGLATMIMVTAGVMLGRMLGSVVGRRAECFGGVVLIGLGALILAEHTGMIN